MPAKPTDANAALINRHVAGRIRKRRHELGYTQAMVADQIGVTYQQVQKYENAKSRITAEHLYLLARALKTKVDYFYLALEDTLDPVRYRKGEEEAIRLRLGCEDELEVEERLAEIPDRKVRHQARKMLSSIKPFEIKP